MMISLLPTDKGRRLPYPLRGNAPIVCLIQNHLYYSYCKPRLECNVRDGVVRCGVLVLHTPNGALLPAVCGCESAADISAAAWEVARNSTADEQVEAGLYGTGDDKFPEALPFKVMPPEANAAACDPTTLAAVYGNVQHHYNMAPEAPSSLLPAPLTAVVVAPDIDQGLDATSAAFVPIIKTIAESDGDVGHGGDSGEVDDVGHIGSPGRYIYNKPDGRLPGAKLSAAMSGFTGAADWAWDDDQVEAPQVAAAGGLVPNSTTAVHVAEVEATAAAIRSVICDVAGLAMAPPGAAAEVTYANVSTASLPSPLLAGGGVSGGDDDTTEASCDSSSHHRLTVDTNVRGLSGGTSGDDDLQDDGSFAAAVARLPSVPVELDKAVRETLGPEGRERAVQQTAVAMATIAPPRYVTPLPPRLLDILREPSARDLVAV